MTTWKDIEKIVNEIISYLGHLDLDKTYSGTIPPQGLIELKKIYPETIEKFNKWFSSHPERIDINNTSFINWVIGGYSEVRGIITLLNYQIKEADEKLNKLLFSSHAKKQLILPENVKASQSYNQQITILRTYLVEFLGCGGKFLSWYSQWLDLIINNLIKMRDNFDNLCLNNRQLLLNAKPLLISY